jgi:glycosyltransferase involved in cell wall biosynthesis
MVVGKMKKILLVISSLHHGGAETIVADLYRSVDRQRFEVSLCLLKFRGAVGDQLIREGYSIVELPRVSAPVLKYLTFRNLRAFIRANDFEIVHSHCTYSFIDSALCRITGVKFKLVHTFHFGNYPHYKARYKLLEGIASRVAHTLVAVGQHQLETVRKLYKLHQCRITRIWNGVANIKHHDVPVEGWRQYPDQIIIGSIGNLIPQKGYTELLQVAEIVKEQKRPVRFVVVGGGYLATQLKAECSKRGLDGMVLFAGYIDKAAWRALPLFDIFFMPSRWEAMSVALLEAMAAEIPIVATSVGDNALVINDRESGIIVPPYDPATMAQSLMEFIDSPDLRLRLAKAARAKFEKDFTVGHMVKRYEALYSSVCSEG